MEWAGLSGGAGVSKESRSRRGGESLGCTGSVGRSAANLKVLPQTLRQAGRLVNRRPAPRHYLLGRGGNLAGESRRQWHHTSTPFDVVDDPLEVSREARELVMMRTAVRSRCWIVGNE